MREYFAGQALIGLLSSGVPVGEAERLAWTSADLLLEARDGAGGVDEAPPES